MEQRAAGATGALHSGPGMAGGSVGLEAFLSGSNSSGPEVKSWGWS